MESQLLGQLQTIIAIIGGVLGLPGAVYGLYRLFRAKPSLKVEIFAAVFEDIECAMVKITNVSKKPVRIEQVHYYAKGVHEVGFGVQEFQENKPDHAGRGLFDLELRPRGTVTGIADTGYSADLEMGDSDIGKRLKAAKKGSLAVIVAGERPIISRYEDAPDFPGW